MRLAGTVKKQLATSGVTVERSPVAHIPKDAGLGVRQAGLADRGRGLVPDVPVVPFQQFLGDPTTTKVVKAIRSGSSVEV